MKKNILLIGPYSAVGGVSIHIKRLSNLLASNFTCLYVDESPIKDDENEVYNLRSINLIKYFKLVNISDYVHIHSGLWWLRVFHVLVSKFLFGKTTILTIHSLGKSRGRISLFATKLSACLATQTIVVSEEIYAIINYKKAIIKPAFIPPNMEEEEDLPFEVLQLLDNNKLKKIIVGNAFKLSTYDEIDLYGLDLLLELATKIKQFSLDYKVIFVVASVSENDSLLIKYKLFIEKNSLETYLTIIPYKISFVRLILKSDLVVRPTCSDGDALTIREALFLGKPVIASDVVIRPENTTLFKNRDVNDLFLTVTRVLGNLNDESKRLNANKHNFEIQKQGFISIYK